MATPQQVEAIHEFASEQVRRGATVLSLSDLVELWEVRNATPEQQSEDIAAIRASLNDYHQGEQGRDADLIVHEMTEFLGSLNA